jgi:hypothetical protein
MQYTGKELIPLIADTLITALAKHGFGQAKRVAICDLARTYAEVVYAPDKMLDPMRSELIQGYLSLLTTEE